MVRKIKAKLVLQLRAEGLSGRAIAASQQISRNSVAAVLEAADTAELGWDDVADLPDGDVYSLLFPGGVSTRACSPSPTGPRYIGRWPGSA